MSKSIVTNVWRLVFALLTLDFFNATHEINVGAFDNVGLLPEVLVMQELGYALMAVGWCMVLILSFRKQTLIAPELCWFLAGMLFFDVHTTWPLDMPLPPYFALWGTAMVLIQVWAGRWLFKQRKPVAAC